MSEEKVAEWIKSRVRKLEQEKAECASASCAPIISHSIKPCNRNRRKSQRKF